MNNNVIFMAEADTLPELARSLRLALDRKPVIREEWIDNELELMDLLVTARDKFQRDNRRFSMWLAENNLDDLSKDDRAATINLGENLELARKVLEESDRWSIEMIWRDNKGRYEDARLTVRNVPNTNSQETAPPANSNPPITKAETERTPDLVKKFGERNGRVIFNHFDRNTRTTARLCKKLRKAQAAILADFLARTPGLPLPANSEHRLGLNTLWREAPKALAEPTYTLGLSESDAVMKVIADWPDKIGPLVAEWRASGERDAARWYAKKVPPETAAPVNPMAGALSPMAAMLSAATIATITANAEAAAKPRLDPSCRPSHEGPIRHHGIAIWPVSGARYSFAEAWGAITIWHTIDDALRAAQPNARSRAAGFFKPFVGCVRNLNPAAGEALWAILSAQSAHPEKTGPDDNQWPPYDVIQ